LAASNYPFSSFCVDFYNQLSTHASLSPVLRECFSRYCTQANQDISQSNLAAVLFSSGVLSLSRLMQEISVLRTGCESTASELWDEQRKQYKGEIESLRQALEVRQAFDQLNDLHHSKAKIQKELLSEAAARIKAEAEVNVLRKQIGELESRLNAEKNLQTELRGKLDAMGRSTSWKLTAPLRLINRSVSTVGASNKHSGAVDDGK